MIFEPMTSEFMFTSADKPHVDLVVNGLRAGCVGICDYETYSAPRIETFSFDNANAQLTLKIQNPSLRNVETGQMETVTGWNVTDRLVMFGNERCILDEAHANLETMPLDQDFTCTFVNTDANGAALLEAGDYFPILHLDGVNVHPLGTLT